MLWTLELLEDAWTWHRILGRLDDTSTLQYTNIAGWNITIFSRKYIGPSSIAMLVFQSVSSFAGDCSRLLQTCCFFPKEMTISMAFCL